MRWCCHRCTFMQDPTNNLFAAHLFNACSLTWTCLSEYVIGIPFFCRVARSWKEL